MIKIKATAAALAQSGACHHREVPMTFYAKPSSPTRPRVLGDAVTHFWLVQDMARAQGADLVAARRSGALSLEEWGALLTRCRGCAQVQPCKAFLKGNRRKEDQALAGCENRQLFAALAAGN